MSEEPVRVLIVEDSADDAELTMRELRRAGLDLDVDIVQSQRGLTGALEDRSWDIVIGDYTLPGFSGAEALEIVQAHDPELPFIFVSGTIGEETAVAAMRAGARDYVLKGNLSRLGPAVERELREAEARRQRRRAEEALKEKDARFRRVIESNMIGIAFWEESGVITDANDRLLEMIGYDRNALGADGLDWRTLTPPEYADVDRRKLEELEERGVVAPYEKEYLRRDGTRVPVLVGGATFDDAPSARVSFVVDISERKTLEAQLLQAQKLEAVGRLAGGVAHDFNNLLTVIMSAVHFLTEELPQSGEVRELAEDIRDAADAAALLTNQLLAFSRKELVEPRTVDVNELLDGMERMIRRLIGEDIRLTVTLAPDLDATRCDPGQLEQVLLNLAVNARDAMPGGGTLEVRTSAARLDADSASELGLEPGDFVRVSMTDSGTGIADEELPRIFEPFFTTKAPGIGTGLGLSTCRKIVREAGGEIGVDTEPGAGATFDVYLPCATGDRPQRAAEPRGVPRGRETILLVEDDSAVRSVASRILGSLGYRVLTADGGRSALEALRGHAEEIDLLLTDVVMPDLSGREVADHARAANPRIRVLFTSGYTEDALLRKDVSAYDILLLRKPFTPGTLGRKVREVLDAPEREPSADEA